MIPKTMKTEIIKITRENTWLTQFDCGWGNGYILLPEGHKWHGVFYDDIDVNIHGGLTYADIITPHRLEMFNLTEEHLGMWCIGFDTAHYGDSKEVHDEQFVIEETERLYQQCL